MHIEWGFLWLILPVIIFTFWAIEFIRRSVQGPEYPETFNYEQWSKGLYCALCYLGALCFLSVVFGSLYVLLALGFPILPLLNEKQGMGIFLYTLCSAFIGFALDGWTSGKGGRGGYGTPKEQRNMIYFLTGFAILLPIMLYCVFQWVK